jgi:hypothetical protein
LVVVVAHHKVFLQPSPHMVVVEVLVQVEVVPRAALPLVPWLGGQVEFSVVAGALVKVIVLGQ